MKDARSIISERGGIRPLARALGHENHTTVQGWWERNRIPAERETEVLGVPLAGTDDGPEVKARAA